ncbi:Serine/threonine-protein kinase CDG1 [Camellia lanceoleosa]|uniref:Serine/threonine-protein kinase CDG1 n=1 Tax=Camellia lanceoleosa TaxID=1840588 RepID=A0ACC0FGG2_9ERIC|nr:Serine/threonine-protein kinase CDG1 [Camellia lanceoleosa]
MEELSLATKDFSDKSLIGEGKFGPVYKGKLNDRMLVAIKKRAGTPSQEFVEEVQYLSSIHHRNLVSLLGSCRKMIRFTVYEYIPYGSISIHLYGNALSSSHFLLFASGPARFTEKLEFKNRLSIALGAAKDENFIPKVADAGVRNFLGRVEVAGPSSLVAADEIFLAPDFGEEVRRCYGFWIGVKFTITSRYSLSSSQRLFSTSHRPTTTRLFIPNASNRKKSIPNKSPPSPKSTPEVETGNLQDATFLNLCSKDLRVENILVEGSIEGSVVHFHRPRTIAIDSLGAISASGMGMYFAFT